MYDHDLEEVEALGWEEFVSRLWESIFASYRSWTGRRSIGRRWSDLLEGGLGCSQELADWLVSTAIINGPDRGLEVASDPQAIVSGMVSVLADLREELAGQAGPGGEGAVALLDQHARLLRLARTFEFG